MEKDGIIADKEASQEVISAASVQEVGIPAAKIGVSAGGNFQHYGNNASL